MNSKQRPQKYLKKVEEYIELKTVLKKQQI